MLNKFDRIWIDLFDIENCKHRRDGITIKKLYRTLFDTRISNFYINIIIMIYISNYFKINIEGYSLEFHFGLN